MKIERRQKPVKVIIGSDWWTDCDDAVAMRVLVWAHKNKLVEVLGAAINACMEYSARSLEAYLAAEGLPDLRIGIDMEATDYGGNPPYQQGLARNLKSRFASNADAEDAVKLYRSLLENADGKVDIMEIGFPQVLAALLKSEPDNISGSTGEELVLKKVNKLWMMAGNWENPAHGVEHNFAKTPRSRIASDYICRLWPTPITFLGWEISNSILTGGSLPHDGTDNLAMILKDHGSENGRSSWDPMLVLMACINDEFKAGYKVIKGRASVDPETGVNSFAVGDGEHAYVQKLLDDSEYREAINDIITGNADGILV